MRHGISGRKLNRTTSHRKAMFANMATSLLRYEQIKTTLPKAKEIRPIVEKLITLGKKGDLSARRRALSVLQDKEIVTKLMGPIADRYKSRQGGYIRIIKAGFRYGDMAPMAIVELLDRDPEAKPKGPSIKKSDEDQQEVGAEQLTDEPKKVEKKEKKTTKTSKSDSKSAAPKTDKKASKKENSEEKSKK